MLQDPRSMLPEGFEPSYPVVIQRLRLVNFPTMAGPRVNGCRCLIVKGRARLHDLSAIPNVFVAGLLYGLPHGLDGEVVTSTGGTPDRPSLIAEKLQRRGGTPDFVFFVYDTFGAGRNLPFYKRYSRLKKTVARLSKDRPVRLVERFTVESLEKLEELEAHLAVDGYRGLRGWTPHFPYTYGPSSLDQDVQWVHERRGGTSRTSFTRNVG